MVAGPRFRYDSGVNIHNPILKGFNPDPSVVRVGDDYYIATSTFEWYPGVQIHHSRDLVHWQLLTRPLDRAEQLDMIGNPPSGGIWAPCLTYSDQRFWLVYTDVKLHRGTFKSTHNYLVTAEAIEGPWSSPIYLNSTGFDPSLFHDDDGRKWILNMEWEWRPERDHFAGIIMQQFDADRGELVGPILPVFGGTGLRLTEGPHLYRRGEYYYLLTAEGGTGHGHAVTMARSKEIAGPYQVDPGNPILTSVGNDTTLRRSGHADIVETPDGWYMVHLCSRPIARGLRDQSEGWSILGRETAIQRVEWTDDGWLRLTSGGNVPQVVVQAPKLGKDESSVPGSESAPGTGHIDLFDSDELSIHWQWPRTPAPEKLFTLSARPGFLRIYGHEPPTSTFTQGLVARRLQAFRCTATTTVEFVPEDSKQIAGLIGYYATEKFHYLYITASDDGGRLLGIISRFDGKEHFPLAGREIELPPEGPLSLRAQFDYERLEFAWAPEGESWQPVGPVLDSTILSDEQRPGGGFTGAFVGLCCQDLSGQNRPADFSKFEYREEPE